MKTMAMKLFRNIDDSGFLFNIQGYLRTIEYSSKECQHHFMIPAIRFRRILSLRVLSIFQVANYMT